MTKLSTKWFVVWVGMVSLGWLMWLWHAPGIGNILLLSSNFLFTPKEHWQREIARRELKRLFWAIPTMIAIIWALVVSGAATKTLIPPSLDRVTQQFIWHPAVITVMWLLWLGVGFWRWRKGISDRGLEQGS